MQGVAVGMAAGGEVHNLSLEFGSHYTDKDRTSGVVNLIRANSGEASMMARCTGKTVLYNIEPEDLRAITLVTSRDTGIPMVGTSEKVAEELLSAASVSGSAAG